MVLSDGVVVDFEFHVGLHEKSVKINRYRRNVLKYNDYLQELTR